MDWSSLLRTVCLLALCLVIVNSKTSQRPNILFILADDLGWDDVSFHGSRQIPTPNLDALAYDGVILTNYYVQPICTPSRSALMTGKHPIHLGTQHGVIIGSQPWGVPLTERLLPQYLKELNYSTHIVGKWHLGFFEENLTPMYRGFDSHIGYYQGMGDYYDHTYSLKVKDRWGLDFHDGLDIAKEYYGQYSTEIFTTRAEKIIANHDTSQPLFMYFAHQAVHSGNPITPLEAPWKYVKQFNYIQDEKRRKFAGMVTAMDDSIGNVSRALAARGMLDNTIIVFSTDNGGAAAGYDGNMACNYPLRSTKHSVYEGGVRGAGFVWSHQLAKSGYKSNHQIQIFDWLPTLLSAAGYDMDSLPAELDGMDFWHTLSTNPHLGPRVEMLHNIDSALPQYALRVNDMKLVMDPTMHKWDGWFKPGEHNKKDADVVEWLGDSQEYAYHEEVAPAHMFKSDLSDILVSLGRPERVANPYVVSCGDAPHVACDFQHGPCLFNITADPCEYTNLAAQLPDVTARLMTRMQAYNATAVMPLNKPEDPRGWPINNKGLWVPWL